MRTWLSLAAALSGAEARASRRLRAWVTQAGLLSLACSAAVIGFVFLVWAVYLYAGEALRPPVAAALAGLAALILAVALLFAGRLQRGRHQRRGSRGASREASGADHDSAADAAIEALLAGGDLRSSDVVVTSLVAGIVLGASPALRRKLIAQLARRGGNKHEGAGETDAD